MSCEHLICANCASPVAEGRCPTCRLTRSQVHHAHHVGSTPLLFAIVLALLLLALMFAHVVH